MGIQGYQNYKQNSIDTMTQGELLMLLYDELIKRLLRAEIALQKEDYEPFEADAQRCIDIVQYLDDTLDRKYEISHSLHSLYEYFIYSLGRVKIGRNAELLAELKPQLTDLRDTFRQAQKESNV